MTGIAEEARSCPPGRRPWQPGDPQGGDSLPEDIMRWERDLTCPACHLVHMGRNPYGCGYLPPPLGVYLSHCSRHHPADEVRYGAHGVVTFDCGGSKDCPCADAPAA